MIGTIEVLLNNLDEAYDKKGWHGTTLRGGLRKVNAEEALWRPAPGRHNIWELALHAAYWKYAVRRRLTGVKRGSFPLKGSNWFPSPKTATEDEWRAVVDLVDREHRQLHDAVANAARKQLADMKTVRMMYGIAAHDLYHTGQIQIVRALKRGVPA